MTKNNKIIPDDKDVYLAFNTVFTGPNSEVRKRSAIKKLVNDSVNRPEVAQFFQRNNDKAARRVVYNRLEVLLKEQVFNSYLHAKLKFPDLFAKSVVQSPERAASEAEAAIEHARAINGALQSDQEVVDDTPNDSDETFAHPDGLLPDNPPASPTWQCLTAPCLSVSYRPSIPTLFPMRLPFITGHKIMTAAQIILEQACFDFAKQNMPELLSKRGWDCAEAVELNIWVSIFRTQRKHLFKNSPSNHEIGKTFYRSLCDVRHIAVHRPHATAATIQQCLRDGELLATLLNDGPAIGKLLTMRCELQRVLVEMEEYKSMLEATLTRTRERITAERAELDRQEKEAIDEMIQADRQYQLHASAGLEKTFTFCNTDVTMMVRDGSKDNVGVEDTVGENELSGKLSEDFEELNFLLAFNV